MNKLKLKLMYFYHYLSINAKRDSLKKVEHNFEYSLKRKICKEILKVVNYKKNCKI